MKIEEVYALFSLKLTKYAKIYILNFRFYARRCIERISRLVW